VKEVPTYCRNCQGRCGLTLNVEENRIVSATSDRLNPYSEGYFCIKGRLSGIRRRDREQVRRMHEAGRALHAFNKYQAVDKIAKTCASA
jgi:anaerobic selenocysteine-containing dehydrogenase